MQQYYNPAAAGARARAPPPEATGEARQALEAAKRKRLVCSLARCLCRKSRETGGHARAQRDRKHARPALTLRLTAASMPRLAASIFIRLVLHLVRVHAWHEPGTGRDTRIAESRYGQAPACLQLRSLRVESAAAARRWHRADRKPSLGHRRKCCATASSLHNPASTATRKC